jgi:hypothetical protein
MSHDEAARILDFSTPTPLPRGGSWTARLTGWEPDRLQRLFFRVTFLASDGRMTTFDVSVSDPADDAAWAAEPQRTHRELGWRIRDFLRLPWDEEPRG